MSLIIAYCTCPDMASAERISRGIVHQHMAACVNLVQGIHSLYEWEGKIQHDNEVLLIIKTTQDRLGAIRHLIEEQHPYELPELIATPIVDGLPDYLEWIKQCTK